MIKAKEWPRSLSPWMVTCFGLSLMLIEAGCSGMTGLRSVGTERQSLLGFWDRSSQGTPTPDNDSYVLSMRAGQARADALAKRDDQPASGRGDDRTAPGDQLASTDESARPRQGTGSKPPAMPDETTIRVSLGRPEPLPGLAGGLAAAPSIALTDPASPWKADKKEAPGNEEAPDIETTAPTRVAERKDSTSPDDWKEILSRASERLEALKTYQMKVSRSERVNGTLQPEEEILLSIRSDPKAVRLEWASGPSKGREVIYSREIDPRMLFVHMPSTAIPLPVMKIPVDSPLVMRNSRHAITEAGLDTIVDNLKKAEGGGDTKRSALGVLSYKGIEKPAGLDRSCHHFVRRTASGESWNVYLDEHSLLPRMVFAQDSHGETIERYVYREIRENPTELAAAGAFEPDQRWGESKGLLSRFARAATGNGLPSPTGSTTR